MIYSVKAKEQVYNSVKFRSTLEARWAIFFDACGLDWVYEPECFKLPAGNYTPDFYLKKYDLYVEIKPNLDWVGDNYDLHRYVQCPKQLLVLSVPFPSIIETSALFSQDLDKYDEFGEIHWSESFYRGNFCPNHEREFFWHSCSWFDNLGDSNNHNLKDTYKKQINAVKKHRFF